MLATAASRTTPGARRLPSQHFSRSAVALTGSVPSTSAQRHRCFCFGSREAKGRRRNPRYRYMESINRHLSWENQPRAEDVKPIIKKHITISTAPFAKYSSGKGYVDVGEVKSWSDDLSGVRPGRTIEDVEREAINHLFNNYQHELWRSPLNSIRNILKSHHAPKDVAPDEVIHATTSVDHDETQIDPITNRRVTKSKSSVREAASSTPEYGDVDKYGPSKWNEPNGRQDLSAEEQSKNYKDLGRYNTILDGPDDLKMSTPEENPNRYNDLKKYKPVQWNEPNGLQETTSEDESKNYSDLHKYEQSTLDNASTAQEPANHESAKQYSDLKNYKPVSWNEPNGQKNLTPEEQSKVYKDLDSYGSVRWNEPDGLPNPATEEKSKQYDDLKSYRAVQWNEPNGLRKPTSEELSKNYDDLSKYNAVQWREPNGLPNPTKEERSKNYEDLGEYKSVQWNEPDGLPLPTLEEASKSYDDVGQYGPVAWSEPHGLRPLNPEEKSKNYDDLEAYSAPFVAKTSVLEEFERAQLDTTPKGNPLPPKVEVKAEDPAKEYTDLADYGPVRWNEPDGLRNLTPEELSKNYNDLHMYAPIRWNEPDGLPSRTAEEKSKDYKDVHAYTAKGQTETEIASERAHPEEASKNYDDVKLYGAVRWNEPDGLRSLTPEEKSKTYPDLPGYMARDAPIEDVITRKHPEEVSKDYKDLEGYAQDMNGSAPTRVHPEEASKVYEDLGKYEPQKFDSPSDNYPTHPEESSKEYKDLGKYSASFEQAEESERTHPEQLTKTYKDLDKYTPESFDPATKAYPVHPEEATKTYKDLNQYGTLLHNEPNGLPGTYEDPTSQGLRPYDSKVQSDQQRALGQHWGRADKMSSSTLEDSMDPLDNLTAQDIRADVLRKVQENKHNETLESAKAEHESSWDATVNKAREQVHDAKAKHTHRLTGNYTQDFSEDFARSWSTANSPSGEVLLPKDLSGNNGNNDNPIKSSSSVEPEDEPDLNSMDECFPCETFKPETALDRQLSKTSGEQIALDGSTSTPNVSQASTGDSGSRETGQLSKVEEEPLMVKTQAETCSAEPATSADLDKNKMVNSFKLLAYDSSTDTVQVADATSEFPSSASSQAPTELILNLSNAAKFFPHISHLQGRGYEIVSGNRNVLVLQKVREASVGTSEENLADTKPHHGVNPIDMMGRPVTGNFASPTGFVNYDTMFEPMASKSTSTRQAEAETYPGEAKSGKQEDRGRRKKRSIGKKAIIGVAWIAGVSYAVGAVAESLTRPAILSETPVQAVTGPVVGARGR